MGSPMMLQSPSCGVAATYERKQTGLEYHYVKEKASGMPLRVSGDSVPVMLKFLAIVLKKLLLVAGFMVTFPAFSLSLSHKDMWLTVNSAKKV